MKHFAVMTAIISAVVLILTGCGTSEDTASVSGDESKNTYKMITQKEAARMMVKDDGHIVVDVRRRDEYEAGHIPGAVCIPNESIGAGMPEQLTDTDQIILIYCRSGRRSKEAAQKLADLGYKNVYEFGGIIDWSGETVTGNEIESGEVLVISAGDFEFYAGFEDNGSAKEFTGKLRSGPITVSMSDYGGFEKVGELPWSIQRNDARITTDPGDVILYQGDKITVYYGENTWEFTKLAHIENITAQSLLDAFGDGDVTVTFSLGSKK